MQREQYQENRDSIKLLKKKRRQTIICLKNTLSIQAQVTLYKNLNTTTDIEENKTKVNKIKGNLVDLMMKFKNNPTNAKKIRNRNNLVEIVELILKFNQLDQKGSSLKISAPNQMLSRLPISLAQLKAGNNSEKLKNGIRQILYSLYRSKKLIKNVYKSLIDII